MGFPQLSSDFHRFPPNFDRILASEELVGWDAGDFEINDVIAAVEPYDKLWTLVYEHQKAGRGSVEAKK